MPDLGGLGGDTIGALLLKVKPDGSTFNKDLSKIVGPGTDKVLGQVQNGSRAALGVVAAVGGGLLALGTQLDSAYDTIRTNTGATGDALQGLKDDFSEVAKQVPEDLDTVGGAIAGLNQKLGLTGKPLQDLAVQFLDLSHITGEDMTGAVDAVSKVFNQFNVEVGDQSELLDSFFATSQASGVSVTELADAVNKSGAVLADFGLNAGQSADLIGLLAKNGISAKESGAGLTKVLKSAAKAGVPAADALKFLSGQIKGAASDSEAAGIAIDAFGPRVGAKLAGQIRDGTLSLDDFSKSLGTGNDTIVGVAEDTADAAETFKRLKNQLAITLGPAANRLFNSFGKAASDAAPALLTFVQALTPIIEAIASLPAPVLASIVGILTLGATIKKVIQPIGLVISVIRALTTVLAANPYIILIAATVALVVIIVKNWDTIKETIVGVIDFLGFYIGGALEGIRTGFADVFGAIGGIMAGAFTGAQSAISGVVDWIVNIPNHIGQAFSVLTDILFLPWKVAFNLIADAWNHTVGSLKFTLPSWVPELGGKGIDIPDIPHFAGGGSMNGIGIVGEKGRELFVGNGSVIPHDATERLLSGSAGVTVQGPLVAIQGPLTIRSDQDITDLSRKIVREQTRALAAKGQSPAFAGKAAA